MGRLSEVTVAKVARAAIILTVYFVAWLALDALAARYAGLGGPSPWYLGIALSFYLVYTFGEAYIPALFVADILRAAFLGHQAPLTYPVLVGFGLRQAVICGGAASLLRRVFNVRIPFDDLRDVMIYVLVVCVSCVIGGVIDIAIVSGMSTPPPNIFGQIITYSTGDAIGFFSLVPALALFVTPYVAPQLCAPRSPNEPKLRSIETAVLVAVLVGCAIVGYDWLNSGDEATAYYFLFLPLVWMAARGGLRSAALGITAADLSVVALNSQFQVSVAQSAIYQSFIAASSLTALTLGAVVSQLRREQYRELELARTDGTTGLPNPQALDEWLDLAQTRSRVPMTLLLVAIDNVRWVRDGLPRSSVDAFMRQFSERMSGIPLLQLFVGHVTESDFAIFIEGGAAANALLAAEKIRRAFEEPLAVGSEQIYAAISIGIAARTSLNTTPQMLIPNAEQALDEGRDRGSETVAFHTGSSREPLISLSAQLHKSHRDGDFEMFYQPIFEFVDNNPSESDPLAEARVIGAEALLRWNHPQRGLLTPISFIDLLESMSLGERVGNAVVEMACDRLAQWHASGMHIGVWINAFGRQVLNPEFGGSLRATLLQRSIDPRFVVIELLEREIARDEAEIVAAVGRIRQAGIRLAIDDFGTGHSSLARLREVPFDILKVDRSFINGIETDSRSTDVVTTLGGLARDFGAVALAEGVESHAQLRFVLQHRYKYVQGYYLGLPMTAAEFESFSTRVNATA